MKKVLINIAYKAGSMSEIVMGELRGICGKYLEGGSYSGSGYDGRRFDCTLAEGSKLGTMFFTYNGLMEDKDICNFENLLSKNLIALSWSILSKTRAIFAMKP